MTLPIDEIELLPPPVLPQPYPLRANQPPCPWDFAARRLVSPAWRPQAGSPRPGWRRAPPRPRTRTTLRASPPSPAVPNRRTRCGRRPRSWRRRGWPASPVDVLLPLVLRDLEGDGVGGHHLRLGHVGPGGDHGAAPSRLSSFTSAPAALP
uniref:Uncharacterized protein n=1 Tax=Triticum urartu TaxID=4572 RepID=A0A8R7UL55_TRIUA